MNTPAKPASASWKEAALRAAEFSPFKRIGDEWMIVAAGTAEDWNGMTASWGGFGVLWGIDVAYVFIRPTRHSFAYAEKSDRLSLSFFDEGQRAALKFFGSKSGRDCDKAAGAALSPIQLPGGALSFAEAREVLLCRKLYADYIRPENFIDPGIATHYAKRDYHRVYVAAIEKRLVRY